MNRALLLAALMPALLAGCAGMSGLSGSTDHLACHAPKGVLCSSISGVYANSVAGTLPSQQVNHGGELRHPAPATGGDVYATPSAYVKAPASGEPVLSPPRVLRVWIAPWKDQDGDLRDQEYVYVMWDRGNWQLAHTERQIEHEYAPIRPLTVPGASSKAASPSTLAEAAAGSPSGVPGVPNPIAATVPTLPGGPKSLDAGDTP